MDSAALHEAEALRRRLAEVLAERDELATQRDELATQRDELQTPLAAKNAQLAWYQRMVHGRRSEKLTHEELGQLVLAYGATQAEAAANDPTLPIPTCEGAEVEESPRKIKHRRPNHRGRTKLSDALERHVTLVSVPDGERTCKCCGVEMKSFDFVDHERVEYVPAKFVVYVERREKLGCPQCKGDAVTAERQDEPDRPLRVGASLLAHLIESKCDDALPIHRQCDQFARLGFELPVSTAYGYWRYATDLLLPISDAVLGTVLEDPDWVGIDDTRLDVLDTKSKNGKYRGHLWCFRSAAGLVAYRFTETWKAEEIAPWIALIGSTTHVQVDDYKGYSTELEVEGKRFTVVPPERRLGCMMHVRRRFYDAFKAGDKRASEPIRWTKELYKIEERARGKPPEQRLALRQEHSEPILDAFDEWVDEHEKKLGKTGKLAEAVKYAKQQREYIRRCFRDGRFEIDNGAVERAIREPAVGRKNFLFTGSANAAKRIAGAYTLVQTCRALGISTRDYLIDVITKLERGWPARRLTELLPHRWAQARQH